MHRGYIALWRKFQESDLWQIPREFSKAEAWLDMLMTVNHKDKNVIFGNKTILCKRGQSIKSLETWAIRWGWKSKYKVREFFKLLKNLNRIITENLTQTTRITILNYELYQNPENAKKTQGKRRQNGHKTQTKPNNNENNVNKDNNVYSPTSDEVRLSELLLSLILKRNPAHRKPDIQKWAIHINRMISINKRSPKEIERIIMGCQEDQFWYKNILSTEKLREKYDQLFLIIRENRNKNRPSEWRRDR